MQPKPFRRTGLLGAPSPRLKYLPSAATRLLQCDSPVGGDRRLWCSAQVWSSWTRPSRSGREEGADMKAWTAHFPTQEAGARWSASPWRSWEGRLWNGHFFFLGSHDLRGCGCRYYRTAGRWHWQLHDVTRTAWYARSALSTCRHGDAEMLERCWSSPGVKRTCLALGIYTFTHSFNL